MRITHQSIRSSLVALLGLFLFAACGGGGGGDDGSSTASSSTSSASSSSSAVSSSASSSLADNEVTISVDNFIAYLPNRPFVSVTVCVPGSSTCKTVDHVLLDTGSTGLRLLSSVLGSSFVANLPAETVNNTQLSECAQFGSGNMWGAIQLADVRMGGEKAENVPLQIVGEDTAAGSAPTACTGSDTLYSTVAALGANGILGVGQAIQDCGSQCTGSTSNGLYYGCPSSGAACGLVTVATSQQVTNPVSLFEADNNGIIVTLPAVSASGAATVSGVLTFGIATRSNNALSATAYGTTRVGDFVATYSNNGISLAATGFTDTGTNAWYFYSTEISTCGSGIAAGWFCPGSTSTQSVTLTSVETTTLASSTRALSFSIGDAASLFATGNYAFSNTGAPSSGYYDMGLPFFYGRSVYVGFEGMETASGPTGPYLAF